MRKGLIGAAGGVSRLVMVLAICLLLGVTPFAAHAEAARKAQAWLQRMSEAAERQTYQGSFVVSSNEGMRSVRVWHIGAPGQQLERVTSLSGAERTTLRHNDLVLTLSPASKTVLVDQRDMPVVSPLSLRSSSLPEQYEARMGGQERVAGQEVQVLDILSRDRWRYAYRLWVDASTALVLRTQTLDTDGQVLEESSFTEIQLQAPLKAEQIVRAIRQALDPQAGMKVLRVERVPSSPEQEGWRFKAVVPGYQMKSCYKQTSVSADRSVTLQCVFSDGLSHVSVFVGPWDASKQGSEGVTRLGPTRCLTRKQDVWWITVLGEAPASTLRFFADALERRK